MYLYQLCTTVHCTGYFCWLPQARLVNLLIAMNLSPYLAWVGKMVKISLYSAVYSERARLGQDVRWQTFGKLKYRQALAIWRYCESIL